MKITAFKDIPQFTRDGHYQVDYPIDHLVGFLDEEIRDRGLQLNPDFQRGNVWTEEQQIAYIEFLLKGGKSATLAKIGKNEIVSMDVLAKLCKALQCDIGDIIEHVGKGE